ncbi:MAG: hypothetical protein K6F00_09535 [Lachnospiraceae bacterium]|nr:hypothetical protein [Lachnospiraceae bacterium]
MIIITWAFDMIAILLSVGAFILNIRDAKPYKTIDDLFGRLCMISIVISVLKIVEDTISPGMNVESLSYSSLIIGYLYDMFDVVLLFVWILFVDFMIYRSEDHLRIIRPGNIKLLTVISVMETVLFIMALHGLTVSDTSSGAKANMIIKIWVVVSYYVLKLIETVMLVKTIIALMRYRNRRKGPVMFRGMPFYLPVLFGWSITFVFNYEIDLNPLGTGLGIFLLYLSMREERRFVDSDTGFFSKAYLTLLSDDDKKRNYKGGLGMLLNTDDDSRVVIEILKNARPEEIDIIRISKGTFFLVGEWKSKTVIEFFRQNIEETAVEEGIAVSVKYGFRGEGESAEKFLTRIANGPYAGNYGEV